MDNETGQAQVALITLSKEDLQELMEKAAVAGAKAGIDKFEAELKNRQKQSRDKRYHNTKLLLRNYRMLQINAENSVFGRSQMEESAVDILDSMMNMYNDEVIVESIKTSATRTAIIVGHIKTMLNMFKVCCDSSGNEIDRRRYDVIYGLYISDPKATRKELMEKWSISSESTYSDEKIAIERLSALIFGVDGLT